ncbi:Dam family site-specific DNA-(adenine-N6)-methyltransferase [Candidatus Parcubacteria bacterium]|nr:Dam family site-specific DNA-(adenine-N6)-methyltransferase [Candidatus Parcubacteria bacterium]
MSLFTKDKYKLEVGVKPPLKWAGGKRWLVPELIKLWMPHMEKRLVEPFAGGLAVTLGLLPKRALVNDINEHLINFYLHLRKGLKVNIPLEYNQELYYQYRTDFNNYIRSNNSNSKEAAILFYYLNRTGFNGLCRFNSKGEFNVPFGKYKTVTYKQDFEEYKKLFSKWQFMNTDFENLDTETEDFIYADPPYDVQFTQYSTGGFTWDDQIRTAEWLSRHKGPVVLSNQATDRIIKLYKKYGFSVQLLDAPRMINSTGDRTKAKEVLATRNL